MGLAFNRLIPMAAHTENYPMFEREILPRLPEVASFARRLCTDEQDSNDLVQETMFKAWAGAGSYSEGSNARAWLFQICKNTQINRVRRAKRERPFSDFLETENGSEQSLSDARHEVLETDSLGDEVSAALNSIPQDCKTAVLLCDIEGYSYEEIANLLRVPVGTIRSRLHRGRKILALRLKGYARARGYSVAAGEPVLGQV